jgi:hypothetical protein
MENAMTKIMEEAHSSAVFNKLIKTQHEILLSELAKIENLNGMIVVAKAKRESDHLRKMRYYQQTQELLSEEIKRKDAIIDKLGIIGLH